MSLKDHVSAAASALAPASIAGIIGGLVGAYFILSTFLQYRKLQHIKGPWLAAISPAWMFYHSARGELYLAVEAALKKYGKLASSARRLVTDASRLAGAHRARYSRNRRSRHSTSHGSPTVALAKGPLVPRHEV